MASYRSPAKKLRSINRLIKFIKKKCLEEVQPSLSIEVLPSTSFSPSLPSKPKPMLSFSRPTLTDVPPEVHLNQNLTPYLPRSLKDVSLTQLPPQSSVLPNGQSFCTTCQKIFHQKKTRNTTKKHNMDAKIATSSGACCPKSNYDLVK